MPRVTIDKGRCKGCELCVSACPQQVLNMSTTINDKGYFFATAGKPELCIGCRLCAVICPDIAIEVGVHGCRYEYFSY